MPYFKMAEQESESAGKEKVNDTALSETTTQRSRQFIRCLPVLHATIVTGFVGRARTARRKEGRLNRHFRLLRAYRKRPRRRAAKMKLPPPQPIVAGAACRRQATPLD